MLPLTLRAEAERMHGSHHRRLRRGGLTAIANHAVEDAYGRLKAALAARVPQVQPAKQASVALGPDHPTATSLNKLGP